MNSSTSVTIIEAQRQLTQLRERMRAMDLRMGGNSALPPSVAAQLQHYLQTSQNAALQERVRRTLLTRFEQVACRLQFHASESLKPYLLRELEREHVCNRTAFPVEERRLVTLTLFNGDMSSLAGSEEFREWHDSPGVFRRAVVAYPRDPVSYLRKAKESIRQLEIDPEFADFQQTPGLFQRVVLYNSARHPTEYLRLFRVKIEKLKNDARFREFHDTPGLFRHAVINKPANPEAFLRRMQRLTEKLRKDKALTDFQDTPGLCREAILRHPGNPGRFLKQAKKTIKALEAMPEFQHFKQHYSRVFRIAAVYYSANPCAFLRRLQGAVDEMERSEDFAEFRDTPGIYLDSAVKSPKEPLAYLRHVQMAIRRLEQDKRFAPLRNPSWIIRWAACRNPSDPEAYLEEAAAVLKRLETDPEFQHEGRNLLVVAAVQHPRAPEEWLRNRKARRGSSHDTVVSITDDTLPA